MKNKAISIFSLIGTFIDINVLSQPSHCYNQFILFIFVHCSAIYFNLIWIIIRLKNKIVREKKFKNVNILHNNKFKSCFAEDCLQAVLLEPMGVAHNGVESIDVKGQVHTAITTLYVVLNSETRVDFRARLPRCRTAL